MPKHGIRSGKITVKGERRQCTQCGGTGREKWERQEWAFIDARTRERSWLDKEYSYKKLISSVDPDWEKRIGGIN